MVRNIAVVLAWVVVAAGFITSQELKVNIGGDLKTEGGYFRIWDSTESQLLLYRDVRTFGAIGVRVIDQDKNKNVYIYPLKDFSEAKHAYIWDAAATPEGGAVLSAIISYRESAAQPQLFPPKSVLLTYDARGALVKLWDVRPYHHMRVAVDKQGNVYALGARNSDDPSYPMLVKYSPEGKVLREFLPANTYHDGDKVITNPSSMGSNRLFIEGDDLFLWLAGPSELWRFSNDGSLRRRVPVRQTLDRVLNRDLLLKGMKILGVGVDNDQVIFQVLLRFKDSREKTKFAMISVSANGANGHLLGPLSDAPSPGEFLGTTAAGRPVFFVLSSSSEGAAKVF
jgi:hypothetical protein